MVSIRNNSFYKKVIIPDTGVAKLLGHFKDFPTYETTSLTLEGGPDVNRYVLSGSIPETPKLKQGVLNKAKLVTYTTASDLSESAQLPQASLYKIKQGVSMGEGKASMTANGDKLFVMSSMVATDNMYMEESFDGAEKTLGSEGISESSNGGVMMREKPYGLGATLATLTYVGGTYSIFHASSDEQESGSGAFLRFYFGMQSDGITKGDVNSRVIFLKPINRNKLSGRWTTKHDHRTGLNVYTVFRPEWKWNQIKSVISFLENTPVSENADATTPATKSNTIFQTLRSSPSIQTALSENLDGEPWAFSTLELSQENADVGGQSLKLGHFWNLTAGTKASQDTFGSPNSINPQFACASGDILPFPVPLDQAFSSQGQVIQNLAGGSTIASPEVNVKFNITELGNSLRWSGVGGTLFKFDKYANNPSTSSTAPEWDQWTTWGSSAGEGSSTNTYTTYLRSFSVTFGNYPVVAGESLDSYLKRGMEGFYWGNDLSLDDNNYTGVAANPWNPATTYKAKGVVPIVGGFTVQRFMDSDDDDSPRVVTASPLLTRYSPYGYKGAASERAMMVRLVSGTGHTLLNADANIMAQGASSKSEDGTIASGRLTAQTSINEPSVALTMDQFVNAKVVFNMNGTNSRTNCDLARVYFTDGVYSENEDTNVTSEPPSMNMYFPLSPRTISSAPTAPEGTITDWSWPSIPEFWPRYMTVWLQNYSFFDGVSGAAGGVDGRWGYHDASDTTFGAVMFNEYPVASGARIATAYVDSISLKNFTPEVNNHSAVANTFSKPLAIRSEGISAYTQEDALLENPVNGVIEALPRYVKGWASMCDTGGEKVEKYYEPTYVTIGMDAITEATHTYDATSAGAISTGDLLWNGFSTPAFSGLENVNKYTTKTWVSSVAGSLSSSLPAGYRTTNLMGYQMFGNKYAAPMSGAADGSTTGSVAAASAFVLPSYWASGNWTAGDRDGTGTYGTPYTLYLASGNSGIATRSFNAFTSKGTMSTRLTYGTDNQLDTGAGNPRNWVKRENVLASSKITAIPEFDIDSPNYELNNRSIRVQNPEVFRESTVGETNYVIYVAGAQLTDAQITGSEQVISQAGTFGDEGILVTCSITGANNQATMSSSAIYEGMTVTDIVTTSLNSIIEGGCHVLSIAAGTEGAATAVTLSEDTKGAGVSSTVLRFGGRVCRSPYLTQANSPQNEIITFTQDVRDIVTSENLPYLYASPVKQWLNMEIYPGSGNALENKAYLSGSAGSNITYDSILSLGEVPSATTLSGSTFNEFDYGYSTTTGLAIGKNGVYRKPWILDTAEVAETSLDLLTDFGFGAYDPADDTGGEVDVQTLSVGYQTEFDFTVALKSIKDPEEPILFTLQLHRPTNRQSATLTGNDSGNSQFFKPYYLFEYTDKVPLITDFTVKPAFDGVSKDVNLYELGTDNLNAVVYNWDEEGDDIWYKYIIRRDNQSITNKYSRCMFHAPLNEPDTITSPGTASTYKAYSYDGYLINSATSADLTNNPSSPVKATVEGLAGYAPLFDGANNFISIPHAQFSAPNGTTEYSIVVHAIPASGMTGKNVLISKGTEAAGIVIYASGSTTYNQKIYATIDSATALLTGTSTVVCDGETPLNVIFTFKQTTQGRPNMELYVNGRLESYGVNNTLVTSTVKLNIGSSSAGADSWDGTLEEVLIYDQQLSVVERGTSYLHSTVMEEEYEGGVSTANLATKNARLFAFDYTNIRGTSSDKVAMSNETSWEVTPL